MTGLHISFSMTRFVFRIFTFCISLLCIISIIMFVGFQVVMVLIYYERRNVSSEPIARNCSTPTSETSTNGS